jgi:hypothetical protein
MPNNRTAAMKIAAVLFPVFTVSRGDQYSFRFA